jgi:hypothetical protein
MDAQRLRFIMLPLVEFYGDRGLDVMLTEDGMRLRLPEGTVVLGIAPRFEPSGNDE